MPVNAHDLSVAFFVRGLTNLKSVLRKGEAHAAATGRDPVELLRAQLAPDMHPLAAQVHWAGEGAKLAVDRLVGVSTKPRADDAKSFAELHERVDATVAYLGTVAPADLEAGLARTIEVEHRGGSMRFVGEQFLLQLAIPGFFFHVTMAYAVLRQEGVAVTKGDFMGALGN